MEWSEINNPEKGYIKNDKVVVEAHIIVQKVVGVRKSPRFDFLSYHPHTCDAVLVIEGRKLHISKTVGLSGSSSIFSVSCTLLTRLQRHVLL